MHFFLSTMFRRIIPNLKKIGLLTDRVRPRYEDLGLLKYETGKAATDRPRSISWRIDERPLRPDKIPPIEVTIMRIDDTTYRELLSAIEAMPAACAHAPDEFTVKQLTLSGNLFIQSLNAAVDDLDARTFRDIDFSFRDLETSVETTGLEDAFSSITASIRDSLEKLRAVAGLQPDVIAAAEDLKQKLAERKSAVERAAYLPPDAPHEPPPHDPQTLAPAADSLRRKLNAGGFETPVMDELATSPSTFEVRDCAFLIDEMDGILA